MNHKSLNIVFYGLPLQAEALEFAAEARGWNVFVASEMMEALAQYVFYLPDAVIIDMTMPDGEDTFEHLRSVDARPLVLLGAGVVPMDEHIVVLPGISDAEMILDTLSEPVPAL